jgi:hypothetical protein
VLAELAEQRAQLEAERLALKSRGKQAKKAAAEAGESDDESEGEPEARPGVSLVSGTRAAIAPKPVKAAKEDSPPPLLFDSSLPTLQAALEQADVWLEVVDARDPMGGRSPWLEQLFETPAEGEKVARGKVVVVLTKIGAPLVALRSKCSPSLFAEPQKPPSARPRSPRGTRPVAPVPPPAFSDRPLQVVRPAQQRRPSSRLGGRLQQQRREQQQRADGFRP